MQIKRLQIDDYLCLVDFDIVFDTVSGGSSTILIGENGAGKSTMIECILNILMSFDSPAIEKQIDYSYSMEYNYAQKAVCIVQSNHELICFLWDLNNSDVQIPENIQMPDYLHELI